MFGGKAHKRVKIDPEFDWLSDDNRAGLSDGKDEYAPVNRAADGYLAIARASADLNARVPIGMRAGGYGEAGMESEEGTAFESLPRRKLCRNTVDQPFLFLNPQFIVRVES